MKRRFCLVLSLLMLAVCIHALAESAEWNYDAEYCVLRGYSGAGGDVAVPGEINGGTVDVIDINVFTGETITALSLPETVLELRSNAITWCPNLVSVSLPQSLVVINRLNFGNCGALAEVTIPAGVRYIGDRYLPDKAIDLIDEAASRVRLGAFTAPPDLKDMEDRLRALAEEKDSAVNSQEFEHAAQIRDEQKKLSDELERAKHSWREESSKKIGEVTADNIAEIVCAWTGIPVSQLTQAESERLLHLEDELHRRIVGQDEAVSAVARAIRRGRVGLKDPKRPTGSFIFLGPTGVGKTELCKALADSLFGDENAMIRLDMSEYMEKHTVSRLVGSPPGYIGYDEGGQLTEKVRRRPYSVILFDEIEKAHPDVFNMLLQILDDGILTDSQGRRVDFKNCIIIMTSNVGAKLISGSGKALGFSTERGNVPSYDRVRELVMKELKNTFRPEFLNRVDDIIVFHSLEKQDISEIARRMLETLSKRVAQLDITLIFDESAVQKTADAGFDPVYGARPLKRVIQQQIEDKLSEQMLEGKVTTGKKYICKAENGEFIFAEQTESESAENE